MLTLAGVLRVAQRRQDRNGCVHPGEQVGHRNPDLLRTAAEVVALARDAHEPAHALYRIVVAGALAVRTGLPEARDAAIDQPGVDGAQRLIVQPVTRHVPDLEVLDEHFATLHQFTDQRLPRRLRDVAGNGALVAIGSEVIGGLAGVEPGRILEERRAPGSRVVAGSGALGLADVRAQG